MNSEQIIKDIAAEFNVNPCSEAGYDDIWYIFNSKTCVELEISNGAAKIVIYIKDTNENEIKHIIRNAIDQRS